VPTENLERTSDQEQLVIRRYRDEVLEVEDSGRVKEVERRFLEAVNGLRDHGSPRLERTLDPLHQRELTLARDAEGKRIIRLPPGADALPKDATRSLQHTERYEAVLPQEPVPIGAEWTIEGEPFRRALGSGLGHDPQGQIQCKLLEVKEEELDDETPAEPYAIIALRVRASGKQTPAPDAPELSSRMEGKLRFSLKRKKVVTVDLSGTARLRQTRTEGDVTVELSGKGPITLTKRAWFPRKPEPKKPR